MNFAFYLENGEPLEFLTTLPPELSHYQVFPQVLAATGPWGAVILQVMNTPEFPIWYSNYLIKEDCSVRITADIQTIGLHVALKNNLRFDDPDLGDVRRREGQFNIAYLAKVNTVAHFKKGEYISFDINYPKDYLIRFIPHLSNLEDFLSNSEKGISGHLSPTHYYATHQMMNVINDILTDEYNDGLRQIYIESKSFELLLLAIKRMGIKEKKNFILNPNDVESLVNVKTWLVENVDNAGSLSELSRRFGVSEYKLKRGFKDLFDVTICNFLLSLRMEKAKKMLLETNIPVTEIAYIAGYSSGSHFADAFKRYFNIAPNYLRKK